MATTTDFCLSLSSKQNQIFSTSFEGKITQYDNLNLNNQNKKCSKIEFLQSSKNLSLFSNKEKQNYGKIKAVVLKFKEIQNKNQNFQFLMKEVSFGKISDFTDFVQSKVGLNVTLKSLNLLKQFGDEKDEEQKQWKKEGKHYSNSTKANNNSTLSLHISAYENSILDCQSTEFEKQQNNSDHKAWKNFQPFNSIIQNPFEFPRHPQKSQKNNDPEIMRFKASQELLDPNKNNKNNNNQKKTQQSLQNNKNGNDYKGLKQVKTPLKKYLKERFTLWFRSFRSSKNENNSSSNQKLNIAHTDWHQQDNIDTEGDADSEYEIDQRIYDDVNLTSIISDPTKKQQFQLTPASYDSETALPAFEGAGTEPNTAILVPTEIWSLFIPAPRPQ